MAENDGSNPFPIAQVFHVEKLFWREQIKAQGQAHFTATSIPSVQAKTITDANKKIFAAETVR